jgi:hypothetical protein
MQPSLAETIVPHPMPDGRVARILLVAIRRIASGGLDDAHAANLLLGALGMGYRRPLMFLRVLMAEVSRVSERQIAIAPCCCSRMTEGEAAFLLAIESGRDHHHVARGALARITGTLDMLPALSIAQALGDSLEDIGRPLIL